MLASLVPQMMRRTLPTVVSGVTGVVTLLVAHTLGRARCGHWGGRLGGRRAARRWHNDIPGGPHAACGGPSSVFVSGDVRPVVWHANDAARQALTARGMLVFAARVLSSTSPLLARSGTGRSAPNEPIVVAVFFLGAIAMKKR